MSQKLKNVFNKMYELHEEDEYSIQLLMIEKM